MTTRGLVPPRWDPGRCPGLACDWAFGPQGDTESAIASLVKCFAILDSFARGGRPMDPQMCQLHAQLKPIFSQP
jgi:hypothetical protein